AHLADALRSRVVETITLTVALHRGRGQEVDEPRTDADGPSSRSATAVRRRERFVQVEVHHVEAHVSGPSYADERIEVGAVVVEKRTGGVRRLRDLEYVLLEDAERVGVGEHDRRDVLVEM